MSHNPYQVQPTTESESPGDLYPSFRQQLPLIIAVLLQLLSASGCALLLLTDSGCLQVEDTIHDLLWFFSLPLVLSTCICPGLTLHAVWTNPIYSVFFRCLMTMLVTVMTLVQVGICLKFVS